MADEPVGPYQIPRITSDDPVQRVRFFDKLAIAINNGLSSVMASATSLITAVDNRVTALGPAWAPRRNVPADADLNTFRIPGLHRITTPDTNTIQNLPPGMRSAGTLENLIPGDGTDSWCIQRVNEQGEDPQAWWRSSTTNFTDWSPWSQVETQERANSKNEQQDGRIDELAAVSPVVSNIALDTDGNPYYSPGATQVHVIPDTDGNPYYITFMSARVAADDNIYFT